MVLSFDTRYPLSYFTKRVEKLSEDQRNVIKRMGFGHLLEMPSQTLSKNLIVELMERWSCEKKAFELPLGEVKIRLMDVALILGLFVTGEPVVLEEHLPISHLEKEYGATIEKRSIPVSYVEKRLESLKTAVTEDFARCFLLFTFGTFLFQNEYGTVDSRYLSFLKDLNRLPQFAWGKAVRENLYEWMSKFKKDKKLRYMGSCLIFLQLWSFEHIDIARPSLPESVLTFPRACRWRNSSSRRREWFTTKFEEIQGNQVVWRLEPTSEELDLDIIRNLLEKQNGSNKLSSTTEHSTNDTTDVDGRDGPLALEEQIIELEDAIVAIIGKSLEMQEVNLEIPSTSQYASANDSAEDENKLRALEGQILESKKETDGLKGGKEDDGLREENSMLKKENDKLKEENIMLKKENDGLREESSTKKKENNELQEENIMLRNRLLSSENFVDRVEKIIQLCEDVNGIDLE